MNLPIREFHLEHRQEWAQGADRHDTCTAKTCTAYLADNDGACDAVYCIGGRAQERPAPAAQPQSAQPAESEQVGDIVVTAQKRNQSAQQVGIALWVLLSPWDRLEMPR
jgi:hypothetical protein